MEWIRTRTILLALFTTIQVVSGFSSLFNRNAYALSRSAAVNTSPLKIVCYYTNWAQYRPKPASYTPDSINAALCTHIIFAFAKINEHYELAAYEWNDESTDWAKGMYQRVVDLKQDNPDLKVMLAVGGWNHGSSLFSFMASDSRKRKNFVNTTIEFLKRNNFDGLGRFILFEQ
jgi:GH18 family chitinase